jgi:hypothetical protein
LSEATAGLTKPNAFRAEWRCRRFRCLRSTRYDETRVIEELAPGFELIQLVNFASTYYVGTRVLKPLLAEALGGRVDVADPNLHWNEWWGQLPAWGDYGTQKLFVFRKRA